MFLKYLEYFVIALVVAFLIVQAVIPAFRGQKLFPAFRTQGKLEKELAEVEQQQQESLLRRQITKLRKKG